MIFIYSVKKTNLFELSNKSKMFNDINTQQNIKDIYNIYTNTNDHELDIKKDHFQKINFLQMIKLCFSIDIFISIMVSILPILIFYTILMILINRNFIITDIIYISNVNSRPKDNTPRSFARLMHIFIITILFIYLEKAYIKQKLHKQLEKKLKIQMQKLVDRIIFDYGSHLSIDQLNNISNLFVHKLINYLYLNICKTSIILFFIAILTFTSVDIPFTTDLFISKVIYCNNENVIDVNSFKYKDYKNSSQYISKLITIVLLLATILVSLTSMLILNYIKFNQANTKLDKEFLLAIKNFDAFLLLGMLDGSIRKLKKYKKENTKISEILSRINFKILISFYLFVFIIIVFTTLMTKKSDTYSYSTIQKLVSIIFNPINLIASTFLLQLMLSIYTEHTNMIQDVQLFQSLNFNMSNKEYKKINKIQSIIIKKAGAGYNDLEIVSFVNLYLQFGNFYKIIGPSGEGKTTMIKLILGLIKPMSGCVELIDKNNKQHNADNISRSSIINQVAYCEQNEELNTNSTILDLFVLFKNDITHEQIIFLLTLVNLKDWYSKQPLGLNSNIGDTLSGGMKKRLQFACKLTSILNDNNELNGIIIIDEGLDSLDPDTRQDIIIRLSEFITKKMILVMVITHSDNLLNNMPHLIIKVDQGIGSIYKCIHGSFNVKNEDIKK